MSTNNPTLTLTDFREPVNDIGLKDKIAYLEEKSAAAGVFATLAAGNGGFTISTGSGTPEGAVTAPIGSLYVNTDGGASTTLYVKTSGAGNTGWTAK